MERYGRRAWLGFALAAGGTVASAGRRATPASAATAMRVWRDPGCGCCGGWVEHMRAEGFAVQDTVTRDVSAARRALGTPPDLLSCHAASVEGYALEGHVPAAAVRRLLAERPPGVRGLAVPAMPIGTPGMEVEGREPDTYDVIAFGAGDQRRSFMRFVGARPA